MNRSDIPEHAPLKPCPFCGREASATRHQAMPTSPVQWSVGCWQDPNHFSREAHCEDCLGATTLCISLERAAAQRSMRARK